MTIKELITKLLDYDVNYEVLLLSDSDPEDESSGVLFHIEDVVPWGKQPQIYFKDWRHERMKKKMEDE